MRFYADRPDPIVFMTLEVNISGRLYDDFLHFLFFHTKSHRISEPICYDNIHEQDRISLCVYIFYLVE